MKSGQYVEAIGHYDPTDAGNKLTFDKERLEHYLKNGAVPSNTVARLLKKAGISGMDKFIQKYTKQKPRSETEKTAEAKKETAADGEAPKTEKAESAEKPAEKTKPEEAKPVA